MIMKKQQYFLLFLLLALVIQYGCKDKKNEQGEFTIEIKAMMEDQPFVINEVYQNSFGYNYKIEVLRFYLSNLTLIKENGDQVLAKDVEYLDFASNHSDSNMNGETVSANVCTGNYSGIRFGIGVDSSLNKQDPASYNSDHPLSIYTNSHWDWNTGYIFLKISGAIDSVSQGTQDLSEDFLYHIGTNQFYREVIINVPFTIGENGNARIDLKIDMGAVFANSSGTINPSVEKSSHTIGTEAIAEKVADFFSEAFSAN